MTVWALGLNHNTAPLDLRGRFAFAAKHLDATLDELRQAVAQETAREKARYAIEHFFLRNHR